MSPVKNQNFQIRGDKRNPYHLSLGLVIKKDDKLILIKKPNAYYTLPRETMLSQESITQAAQRGAREELGLKIEVKKFLGSLITHFDRPDGTKIEKTTIYFLAHQIGKIPSSPRQDEVNDETIWTPIEQAIKLLQNRPNKEHEIIIRACK